jgi:TPR repeat protein
MAAVRRALASAWSKLTGAAPASGPIRLSEASPATQLDEALAKLASIRRSEPSPAGASAGGVQSPSQPLELNPRSDLAALASGMTPAELGALAAAFYHGTPAPVAKGAAAAAADGKQAEEATPFGGAATKRGAPAGAAAAPATSGPPLPRDPAKAAQLWVAAAQRGDGASMFNVALCLVDGIGGMPRDRARAAGILTRLADGAGHAWSAFVLGQLLLAQEVEAAVAAEAASSGDGGKPATATPPTGLAVDPTRIPPARRRSAGCDRAFGYLLSAAKAGVAPAWLNAANCLYAGVGCDASEAQAAGWLQKAALSGDPLAAAGLAARYATGTGGVPKEPRMAARLWRTAAEGGHPMGAHNVGVGYLTPPPPGQPDYAAALVWFIRAGEAGYVRSQLNAGAILAQGATAVPQDLPAAAGWLRRAREGARAALEAATAATASASAAAPAGAVPLRVAMLATQLEEVDKRLAAVEAAIAAGGGGGVGGGDGTSTAASLRAQLTLDDGPPPSLDDVNDAAAVAALSRGRAGQLSAGALLRGSASSTVAAGAAPTTTGTDGKGKEGPAAPPRGRKGGGGGAKGGGEKLR